MFPTTTDIVLHFAAFGITDPEPLMKAFAVRCGFTLEGMTGNKLERIVATRWTAFVGYRATKRELEAVEGVEI